MSAQSQGRTTTVVKKEREP